MKTYAVVAVLQIADELAFTQFEQRALNIMASHGGELLSAFRSGPGQETHCLRFPDKQAFKNYQQDPGLAALAELRSAAIEATCVYEEMTVPAPGEARAAKE